jgi:hypothetical protein
MRNQETQSQDIPAQTDDVSIDAYGRVTLLDPDLLEVVSGGQGDTNNGCNYAAGCGVKPK